MSYIFFGNSLTITRSSSHLCSSIPPSARCLSLVGSNPNAKVGQSSGSSAVSTPARHFSDWRSPISHRAAVRSSAAVSEWFERRFSSVATKNAYESILTALSKPGGGEFGKYYSLPALSDPRIDMLPYSIRVLLESAIRNCDGFQVMEKDVEKILDWENSASKQVEIPFKPARVLLQKSIDYGSKCSQKKMLELIM